MAKERTIFNEDMEEKFLNTQTMSDSELDEIINKYPTSKKAYASLLLAMEASKEDEDIDLDDWECQLGEIMWPEVLKK